MNGFLEDSERFWGQESARPKLQSDTHQTMRDGKYILYKWRCPICKQIKAGCHVAKYTEKKEPILYCKTEKVWITCVYIYL